MSGPGLKPTIRSTNRTVASKSIYRLARAVHGKGRLGTLGMAGCL